MSFWTYILHCRGGAFYIGHTDDLGHRVSQHQSGAIAGFTADKLPVELVWSQDFPTRIEALEAERRIKGWSRAKKMALIRSDWDKISALAKGKDGPSTSSGRTEKEMPGTASTVCPKLVEACPERLQGSRRGLSLVCHPDTPCSAVRRITVSAARSEWEQLVLHFTIEGDIRSLSVPAPVRYASRCDNLWQTTCVEAFAAQFVGAEYAEFNFAPSTAWAAYQFESYRQPSSPPSIDAPPIDVEIDDNALTISVAADMAPIAALCAHGPWRIGLSAVIEEIGGAKSYWALVHPPGKPDFHHPDCFALTLEAPPAA